MSIQKTMKRKLQYLKRNRQWKKERFKILEVSQHTKAHCRPEYIHTAICTTNREVKNFDLLAKMVSEKVGYNTTGYMYCGLNSIEILAKNTYKISWNTWDNCD